MPIDRKYPNLFSPLKVRGTSFKNRIFFSAHNHPQCRANGVLTDEGIAYYEARARGGAAQVSLGETPVDAVHAYKGDINEHLQINVPFDFGYICQMSKFTNIIHSYGCNVSIQLMHAGQVGTNPVGPTGFTREDGVAVKEMDGELIAMAVKSFADSAKMARMCGFDGVQIHGGHGWLLSQFTSPLFNKRSDEYGGSLYNRLRFPIMVLRAVREALGPDMLIEYRISGDEFTEGGYDIEDACEICGALEPYVDLFQVSAGVYTDGQGTRMFPTIYNEHCVNVPLAARIKACVGVPVIAVGSIMTPQEAEDAIASGSCDFTAMARTLIAEPDFANKALSGRDDEIIPCIRCFACMHGPFGPPFTVHCSTNPYAGMEQWHKSVPEPKRRQKVAIVGGGSGGMQAALTAAARGHEVILYEKSERLGGTLWFTDADVHKYDLRRYRDYLVSSVTNSDNIDLRQGAEATPELVEAEGADAVIVAVGAAPVIPPIPGIENARHALEAYSSPGITGERVVIVGGGLVGCETALHLAALGHKVTVVEMLDRLAPDGGGSRNAMLRQFDKMGCESHVSARCTEIRADGVTVAPSGGGSLDIDADTVLYAAGMRPNAELAAGFLGCAPLVVNVGDCQKAAKVLEAVSAGYFAALNL